MTGPAPKHPSVRARRNDARKDFVSLPSEGRKGKAPAWPLRPDLDTAARLSVAVGLCETLEEQLANEDDGRKRRTILRQLEKAQVDAERWRAMVENGQEAELALWAELWLTPQAVEWERSHAFRSVATYVRWQIKAENGSLDAAKEARMWSDRLGLNPLALHRLRQEVEHTERTEADGRRRREQAAPATKKPAARKKPADPRLTLVQGAG
jgi:hypothetical protein